jgi:hypothetical protein
MAPRKLARFALAAGVWAMSAFALAAQPASATPATEPATQCEGIRLDGLAPLVGTWIGRCTWPDGSPLHVRQRFWFGPTRRLLHFESHDLSDTEPRLLYEGIVFIDPDDGCGRQWNVTPDGKLTRSLLSDLDERGFVVRGEHTHSTVRIEDEGFRWLLDVERDGRRERVMEAVYRREPAVPPSRAKD